MKKYLVTILVLFFTLQITQAQWAPNGATWHTGIIESFSSSNQGYIKTILVGDSLVGSHVCKMLESTRINYLGQTTSVDTAYMYYDSGRVYNYRYGSFYTLFDFSLSPGQSWYTIAPYPSPFTLSGNPPDTIVQIYVDSVSSQVISGITKKLLYVHSVSNDWYFLNPIIEDIGSMGGLHPFIYDWMDVEIPLLRCYNDSAIQFQVDASISCELLINDISENGIEPIARIFPNPTDHYLKIEFSTLKKDLRFIIINQNGQTVYKGNGSNNGESVDVGNLPSGMYSIVIFSDEKTSSANFIITHIN